MPFISFSCFIPPARASSPMWKVSAKSGLTALFPIQGSVQSSPGACGVSRASFEDALANWGSSLLFFVCLEFLIIKGYWIFDRWVLCVYRDNYKVFLLYFVNVVNYKDCFSNVKPMLLSWDELYSCRYSFTDILLRIFAPCSWDRGAVISFSHDVLLYQVLISDLCASGNEFKSGPSFSIFWKSP